MCDFETIESVNDELFGNLSELVEKPFFRYFQVRSMPSSFYKMLMINRLTCIENVHFGQTMVHAIIRGVQSRP